MISGIIQTIKQLCSEGIEGYFAVRYAEFAKDTPAMREVYISVAKRVADVISKGTFLEVGPGPAFLSIEIARLIPHAQITGIDISETMIGIGSRNVAEADFSERITFRQGDAVKTPFDDMRFDLVVSSGSLHHWSKPIQVFNEIYRVLKPGKPALIPDAAKMRFYAAIGKQNAWFNEYLHNYRDIDVPAHSDWTTVSLGVNIYIENIDPGTYDVYCKLSGPGPNLITEPQIGVFTVPGAPEEEPPPEEPTGDILVDSFSFTIPAATGEPEEFGADILVDSKSFFIPSTGEEVVPPGDEELPEEEETQIPWLWVAVVAAALMLLPQEKK